MIAILFESQRAGPSALGVETRCGANKHVLPSGPGGTLMPEQSEC